MALNGSLDDYSPAGALRVLSSTGKTGAVRFSGSAACTAYLADGQLYFARGEGTDDALASALVRPGRLSAEAWSRAVEEAGDAPHVGQLLIDHGGIDPDLLASIVLSVIYDPLITLFREGDGRFDFEPGTMHWIGPYRGFNVEAIVNEVRRRVRNVDEMSDIVPSTSAWVSPVRTLPDSASQVTLLREDWELITSLSGTRTIDEVAEAMGRGRYSTAQVVHRLARAGLLHVEAEPVDTEAHEPSTEVSTEDTPATDIVDIALDELEADGGIDLDDTASPDLDDIGSPDTDADLDLDAGAFGGVATEAAPDAGDGDDTGPTGADDALSGIDEEAAWAAITAGNPFDHAPSDEADPLVAFGPSFGGGTGPESDPEALALLPRRTAVREAEPEDGDEPAPAWAAIAGFHDPTAEVRERQDAAVAGAADDGADPNAAWLENLYAQFIDEAPAANGKGRKKEALDVAFQAEEQDRTEKVGTLKRLAAALRRL